jgi:hypothetical protein
MRREEWEVVKLYNAVGSKFVFGMSHFVFILAILYMYHQGNRLRESFLELARKNSRALATTAKNNTLKIDITADFDFAGILNESSSRRNSISGRGPISKAQKCRQRRSCGKII